MTTLQKLGIDHMTVGERIALVQEILDSVAAEQPRPPLSDAMQEFLKERLADAKANPDDRLPWEEVKAAALARYKKKAEDLQ